MPFILFHEHFPEVAEAETRTLTILPNSSFPLPPGQYSFLEMFCNDPKCDCRRVFFCVVSSSNNDVEAIINYGWEASSFYRQWLPSAEAQEIAELKGPALNLGSPQSQLAPPILKLLEEVLLQDNAYVERVKRHYQMFREKIDRSPQNKRKSQWGKIRGKARGFS